jgi:hypothetical protein
MTDKKALLNVMLLPERVTRYTQGEGGWIYKRKGNKQMNGISSMEMEYCTMITKKTG